MPRRSAAWNFNNYDMRNIWQFSCVTIRENKRVVRKVRRHVLFPLFLVYFSNKIINYCPYVRVTWRFVHPRQVIMPSGEVSNIAWGRSPRALLPVEGEQIVMLPSYKGNNCFIMPIDIFSLQCEKKKEYWSTLSLFHLQSNYCEYIYNLV